MCDDSNNIIWSITMFVLLVKPRIWKTVIFYFRKSIRIILQYLDRKLYDSLQRAEMYNQALCVQSLEWNHILFASEIHKVYVIKLRNVINILYIVCQLYTCEANILDDFWDNKLLL